MITTLLLTGHSSKKNRRWMDIAVGSGQPPMVSSEINPKGQPLFSGASEDSALFFVDIPLDVNGVLDNTRCRQLMASRQIDLYRQIYLGPWVENLTLYYQLPKTGLLDLHCLVPLQGRISTALRSNIGQSS
ncbi:MAG: hypothetical protein GY860_09235 [Desulfobacteraceae bacterium]|nr:hypothetical protein [Desulfobacteraceae bacterium]